MRFPAACAAPRSPVRENEARRVAQRFRGRAAGGGIRSRNPDRRNSSAAGLPDVRPTVLLPAAMKPVRATSGGNDVRLAGLACAHIEVERATGDYEAGSGKFAVEWKRAARKILTSRRDRKTGSAGTIPGIHEPQSPYQPSTPDVVVTMRPPGDDRQAAID